ncbi:hypothetical protein [Nocardia sp. IFM 10818]
MENELEQLVRTHIADEYRRAVEMVRIADKINDGPGHYLYDKARTTVAVVGKLEVSIDIALSLPHAGRLTAGDYGWDFKRWA